MYKIKSTTSKAMKNTDLRKQLAYCLKYYKKTEGYYPTREYVEDFQYSLSSVEEDV